MHLLNGSILCAVTLLLCGQSFAQIAPTEVRAEILQIKSDRLYFNVGLEALIFPGAGFNLTLGDTVRLAGNIDHSWEGISVSERMIHLLDSVSMTTAVALIEQASVDSVSPIRISSMLPWRALQGSSRSPQGSLVNEIRMLNETDPRFLEFELTSADLDAIVTMSPPGSIPQGAITTSARIAAAVVLVPNVARSFNQFGAVTTSMYYRFDPEKARLFFASDQVGEINSLIKPNGDSPRPFEYDPAKGRDLLQTVEPFPAELKIYVVSPMLQELALYFADILSRDPCQVRVVSDRSEADVYLDMIPLDPENPSRGLYEAYVLLSQDANSLQNSNEQLALVSNYFKDLAGAVDETSYYQLLARAERVLVTELGVLPLFRPIVYLTANSNVIGLEFDANGRLDLSGVQKLILPTRNKQVAR